VNYRLSSASLAREYTNNCSVAIADVTHKAVNFEITRATAPVAALIALGIGIHAAFGVPVVPMGTIPEPEDSGRATERSLCMVKWIYPLVG
jgi:hypothetical protein